MEANVEVLNGFVAKSRLFGQHGKGVNKAIDMMADPVEKRVWFEVSQNHKTISYVPDLEEAISIYNKI